MRYDRKHKEDHEQVNEMKEEVPIPKQVYDNNQSSSNNITSTGFTATALQSAATGGAGSGNTEEMTNMKRSSRQGDVGDEQQMGK